MITQYAGIAPKGDLLLLQKLGEKLAGRSFLHINSTRSGGGVAEILNRMIPFLKELGIGARWEAIEGNSRFFDITKKIHNALQGNVEKIDNDYELIYKGDAKFGEEDNGKKTELLKKADELIAKAKELKVEANKL